MRCALRPALPCQGSAWSTFSGHPWERAGILPAWKLRTSGPLRARCPRSRERHRMPRWGEVEPRWCHSRALMSVLIIAHVMVDPHYLPRVASGLLERALDASPVIVLMGARQTCKSTMAKSEPFLADRLYLTLDDLEIREHARFAAGDLFGRAPRLTLDPGPWTHTPLDPGRGTARARAAPRRQARGGRGPPSSEPALPPHRLREPAPHAPRLGDARGPGDLRQPLAPDTRRATGTGSSQLPGSGASCCRRPLRSGSTSSSLARRYPPTGATRHAGAAIRPRRWSSKATTPARSGSTATFGRTSSGISRPWPRSTTWSISGG